MDKVADLDGNQFEGVPFARETWIKWPIWMGNNLKAYLLRGKQG